MHKKDPRVAEAIKNRRLERLRLFKTFKKNGIHQHNMAEFDKQNLSFFKEKG